MLDTRHPGPHTAPPGRKRETGHAPGESARHGASPPSFAQERLWLVHRLAGGSEAYHIFRAFTIRGPLAVEALERALGEVVRRHESLRTSFREVDGAPVQVVAPFGGFTLTVEDLSPLDPGEREAFSARSG